MHLLAALGDAPTAAIAVVAILLGVFVVARGRRGEKAAGPGGAEAGPSLLTVPIAKARAAPEPEGLQTMSVGQVGHGTIRLGGAAPAEPAATEPPTPEPAAEEPRPATAEAPAWQPPPPEPTTTDAPPRSGR